MQFLRWVNVLPLTKSIVKYFALTRGELRRNGNIIGDADLFIAATAIHHDLILVTRNVRHFQRVPGLKLHTP
jgi:tRNA(fMet)-specific endonuclease VapC